MGRYKQYRDAFPRLEAELQADGGLFHEVEGVSKLRPVGRMRRNGDTSPARIPRRLLWQQGRLEEKCLLLGRLDLAGTAPRTTPLAVATRAGAGLVHWDFLKSNY